ncbi:MAG: TetR family transcriptional regulator [Protaetiibacter sp.]
MARITARTVAAQRTRTRIMEAAAVLFTERGYGQTTLQAIADRAGVSVETVTLAGPKRRLLQAAFDMAFAGGSGEFPASGEPAYVRLAEEHGLAGAVEHYVRLLAFSIARTSGLWRAFQAAADADAKAAEAFAGVRAVRRAEFHRTAEWLADRGVVDAADVPRLVQEFYVIASHETYLLLQTECSFTPEAFAERLHQQVARLLPVASSE